MYVEELEFLMQAKVVWLKKLVAERKQLYRHAELIMQDREIGRINIMADEGWLEVGRKAIQLGQMVAGMQGDAEGVIFVDVMPPLDTPNDLGWIAVLYGATRAGETRYLIFVESEDSYEFVDEKGLETPLVAVQFMLGYKRGNLREQIGYN